MKAFVDENTCISCGLCEGICPEVFSLESGVSQAKEGAVPSEYEDATREACDSCPVTAISVEE
ncbi:4Fe-4S dicluster domain-containing protein [Clostridium tertium]|uniref:Ferredoxin n=1 Tax=Clostridium tertium TaxID=1559 RepID=A0A6N3BNJ5_9CLOT